MRNLYIVHLIMFLICQNIYSQSIKELEYALSWHKEDEGYGGKIDTAHILLHIDPLNELAINYIVQYYFDRKIDSISIFYNRLIAENPGKPDPYLIRAETLSLEFPTAADSCNYDSLWAIKKEYLLKKAIELDFNSFKTNYALSKLYYFDFLKPTKKIPFFDDFKLKGDYLDKEPPDSCSKERKRLDKISVLSNSAYNALFYLKRTQEISKDSDNIYFFPISQVEKYLYNINPPILDSIDNNKNDDILPSWYFANLTANWASDLTVDYLYILEKSNSSVDFLKKVLDYFNEENLYKKSVPENCELFRAAWVRSFDPPMLFRIEKSDNLINFIWKMPSDSSGPNIKAEMKLLTQKEWGHFINLFKKIGFGKLPNEKYRPIFDGSEWVLEWKTLDYYKAHKTNTPDLKLEKCLMYLLQLTDIKIDAERIY